MPRLITAWSTDTEGPLADMLRMIQGETDPALRLELEAGLHIWQAQKCTRDAERLRMHREGYIRRARKRAMPAAATEGGA